MNQKGKKKLINKKFPIFNILQQKYIYFYILYNICLLIELVFFFNLNVKINHKEEIKKNKTQKENNLKNYGIINARIIYFFKLTYNY